MQFYIDGCEELVEVIWYFVDRTDFIPNNAYVSSLYDDLPDSNGDPVGEVGGFYAWRPGKRPPGTRIGPVPCGTPDQWAGNLYLKDGGAPPCPICSLQGFGAATVFGQGSFFRDRLPGLGSATAFGGGVAGPGAIWAGRGCACASGAGFIWPPALVSTACLCGKPITAGLVVPPEYAARTCACGSPVTLGVPFPPILSEACACGKPTTKLAVPGPGMCVPWWPQGHPAPSVVDPKYGSLTMTITGPTTWGATAPDGSTWTWLGQQNQTSPSTYCGSIGFKIPGAQGSEGILVGYSPSLQQGQFLMSGAPTRVTGYTVTVTAKR
jgi:hypothetical protein